MSAAISVPATFLVLAGNDFIGTGIGISLTADAGRKVIAGYERRMQSEVVHPIFGYKISY